MFEDVLAANAAYAEAASPNAAAGRAARGLAVLTCMDSRIDPLAMLGLAPGDAKILRNAGARVSDDVLATLVVARYLLGVERVMVIAHTDCRMNAASDDVLRGTIRDAGGPDAADLTFGTFPDPVTAVQSDVERVRAFPDLRGLEVGGFIYDIGSRRLTQIV